VALLGDVVYVVCADSSVIEMYSADTLSPLRVGIHVNGMSNPSDIVACCHDRQLYVADFDCCIWQVSADDHSSYRKWLPTDPTDTFDTAVYTLSLRSRHLLVTLEPRHIHQYNTDDRRLLRDIELPCYVKFILHAVETTRGTFVVCHEGTLHDQEQYAVSVLLFVICPIAIAYSMGQIIKSVCVCVCVCVCLSVCEHSHGRIS